VITNLILSSKILFILGQMKLRMFTNFKISPIVKDEKQEDYKKIQYK